MINTTTKSDRGQGIVEYALVVVLISISALLALNLLGVQVSDIYCSIAAIWSGDDACRTTIFADDFENGLGAWQIISGKWGIRDGKLAINAKGEGQIFTDVNESDYVITLKDVILKSGSGFGVAFKADQVGAFNGYTFQYDPGYGNGEFIMRKWANGNEFAPFARQPAPNFDWYDTPHDVKIVVQGSTYSAYVDEVLVLKGTDSTWVNNDQAVGMRVWDSSKLTVDDFTVEPVQ